MSRHSTLYKRTSTGKIQTWTIRVRTNVITTTYGQLNGKMQITSDTIHEGKNIGKSNETTPAQQARAEARAQWEKKIKKGYVEQLDRAEEGSNDLSGGFAPTLAHSFAKQGHKITYPCYVQPKLDGVRCATDYTLWTRTQKPILGVPHIQAEVQNNCAGAKLDGELYNHDYKENFEELISFIRQEVPKMGHEVVQYHVYDVVMPGGFEDRLIWLESNLPVSEHIHLVETILVENEEELMEAFEAFIAQGYEGAIVRNKDAEYEHKRSYNLQKIKEFQDAEFRIIGINEGRGKLMGHAASFICETDEGERFDAKMHGSFEALREYFEDHSLWQDRLLTVQFQGLTGKNGVPRFPIGLRLREDM